MRIRLPLMISVGLALPTLLASPVSAKAMPEFIVSGGDLEHPIYVSADEVIGVVQGSDHGWVMGGEAAAPQRLGKNYDLDLLQFQFPGESFPSQRRIEARWAYHPEASGAMTAEDEWVPFSPKLNGLLLARISDQPQPARPDGDVLPLAALGAACLSAGFAAGRFLRRRGPARLALRGSSMGAHEATAVA